MNIKIDVKVAEYSNPREPIESFRETAHQGLEHSWADWLRPWTLTLAGGNQLATLPPAGALQFRTPKVDLCGNAVAMGINPNSIVVFLVQVQTLFAMTGCNPKHFNVQDSPLR